MEQPVCARTVCVLGWGKNSCEVFGGLVARNTAKWELVSSSGNTRDLFFKLLYVPLRMLCLWYIPSDLGY